jgi:hypothetical protein
MAPIWRLSEDRVEFERVQPAMLDADPDGIFVIQQPDSTFWLRIGDTPALPVGDRFTVAGVEFDTAEIECLRFDDVV